MKVLKRAGSNMVFAWSELLAKQDDMVPGELDVATGKFTRTDTPQEEADKASEEIVAQVPAPIAPPPVSVAQAKKKAEVKV